MSLFAPTPTAGLYASICGDACGMAGNLTFLSYAHTVNSAGESVLSFIETVTLTMDIQPGTGKIQRNVHGVLVDVDFVCTFLGNAPVVERSRAVVYAGHASLPSTLCEVQHVRHYGGALTELDLTVVR